MTNEDFLVVLDDTFKKVDSVLNNKRAEYSPQVDRLINFKVAAKLQQTTPMKALGGMMAKHFVSVYDFIDRASDGEHFTEEKWDEKIIDSINYLILLKGLIREQRMFRADEDKPSSSETVSEAAERLRRH